MQFLTAHCLFSRICKLSNQYGMLLEFDSSAGSETLLAAPYLKDHEATSQCLMDGFAFLLFESEDQMLRHYEMTVGDDGPTKTNSYSGPARVYAAMFDSQGVCIDENT